MDGIFDLRVRGVLDHDAAGFVSGRIDYVLTIVEIEREDQEQLTKTRLLTSLRLTQARRWSRFAPVSKLVRSSSPALPL
jgi:hypothetical protein